MLLIHCVNWSKVSKQCLKIFDWSVRCFPNSFSKWTIFNFSFFHCCYWLITFVYCHVQLISSAKISIDYSFNYPGSRGLSWRYVSTFSTIARTSDLGFKFISVESRLPHKQQQKDSRLPRQPQNQNLPTDYRRSTHLKRGIRVPSQANQQPTFFVYALIDSTGQPLNHTSFSGFGALRRPFFPAPWCYQSRWAKCCCRDWLWPRLLGRLQTLYFRLSHPLNYVLSFSEFIFVDRTFE